MKHIITIFLLLSIMFGICACNADPHIGTEVHSTDPISKKTLADQVVGGWACPGRGDILYIVILSGNGTVHCIDSYRRVSKEQFENNTGTYFIEDDQLWFDVPMFGRNYKYGYDVEINGDIMHLSKEGDSHSEWIRFNSATQLDSIVGAWNSYSNDEDAVNISFPFGEITEIVFYNDGSYKRKNEEFESYGKYEILFDGEAIELTESLDSKKIDIKFLGCGLMLYEYYDMVWVLYQEDTLQRYWQCYYNN